MTDNLEECWTRLCGPELPCPALVLHLLPTALEASRCKLTSKLPLGLSSLLPIHIHSRAHLGLEGRDQWSLDWIWLCANNAELCPLREF